ncbi:hypothetical protein FDG95_gp410 [Pectobacterium phage vB_PcaM_CBB]|uniref:Uncharacterized protein n=1 Tax=Pectobacterium phage vB_PcaM_CBB TaxID=2772511 RepID=A0A1L2CU84_9CAUD|nr:hypothetical protein FDG95_gp016 [Pectobacterium phage vB_PcaM_CBB]YP_009595109.1 hypothetical protein FDG95_gp410 [Pectobacterium phage vB_PcaM_CBB]AMM43581.1 hypothetical protein CBB_16 [Pectobacterium phage vB_PcaM_CBB]AMM44132.1 hypothetical protein CBB_569 [Pectobacterium phage vB_PcaM_CBB]
MDELLKLWQQFSTVSVNDDDEIEESFLHFEKGTDRLEVWKWFENQNPDFKVSDLV